MLPVMTSVDDDEGEIISPLLAKLMYISNNDVGDDQDNDLLSGNKQLTNCDGDNDYKEGTIAETKKVASVDNKLVHARKS